jgi:hypothetical protein
MAEAGTPIAKEAKATAASLREWVRTRVFFITDIKDLLGGFGKKGKQGSRF